MDNLPLTCEQTDPDWAIFTLIHNPNTKLWWSNNKSFESVPTDVTGKRTGFYVGSLQGEWITAVFCLVTAFDSIFYLWYSTGCICFCFIKCFMVVVCVKGWNGRLWGFLGYAMPVNAVWEASSCHVFLIYNHFSNWFCKPYQKAAKAIMQPYYEEFRANTIRTSNTQWLSLALKWRLAEVMLELVEISPI